MQRSMRNTGHPGRSGAAFERRGALISVIAMSPSSRPAASMAPGRSGLLSQHREKKTLNAIPDV